MLKLLYLVSSIPNFQNAKFYSSQIKIGLEYSIFMKNIMKEEFSL